VNSGPLIQGVVRFRSVDLDSVTGMINNGPMLAVLRRQPAADHRLLSGIVAAELAWTK
jgi:hypothetical protein